MIINAISYKDGKKTNSFSIENIHTYNPENNEFIWIALYEPSKEELDIVFNKFKVHELSLEDLEHGHQIAKIEEYDENLFAVIKQLNFNNKHVDIGDVYLFINENFIISIRKGTGEGLDIVRKVVEKNSNLLKFGTGYVLYAILDAIIDRYFPIISKLDMEINDLESKIFENNNENKSDVIKFLHKNKANIRDVKNSILPLLDNIHKLFGGRVPTICNGLDNYYRDAYDHLNKISMNLETLLETTNASIQTSIAMITIEDNKTTKKLAAWAAIFASITFMVGIWGMNFKHMPELDWKYGYPLALLSIATVGCLMRLKFKKSGWL